MLKSSLRNFPGSDIISSCCDVLCPARTGSRSRAWLHVWETLQLEVACSHSRIWERGVQCLETLGSMLAVVDTSSLGARSPAQLSCVGVHACVGCVSLVPWCRTVTWTSQMAVQCSRTLSSTTPSTCSLTCSLT